jgi:hypothetical protein
MVCPNCKSDQVIQVQDQHFCINCGQAVPEPTVKPAKATASSIAVGKNGLPEGVKILPVGAAPSLQTVTEPEPEPIPDQAPESPKETPDPATTAPVVHGIKSRIRIDDTAPVEKPETTKPRKRGRPKAGKLDVPKAISSSTPSTLPSAPDIGTKLPLPFSPRPEPTVRPAPPVLDGPRGMRDLAPRRHAHPHPHAHTDQTETKTISPHKTKPKAKFVLFKHTKPAVPAHKKVHRVGLPPIHFGAVVAFSMRARLQPRLLAIAAAAPLAFALACGYGAWLLLNGGLAKLATQVSNAGIPVFAELGLLAALYYVGRNVGQSAITYGVQRETDHRPIPVSKQIIVGINAFGRHLALDASFATLEIVLLWLMALLLITGGAAWPVNIDIQVAAVFIAFLFLLYLQTALALSRGLAGVALTLTNESPLQAAKFGWRLFSHRFELLGLRFLALALELVLAVPLAALAAAFIFAAPPGLHLLVAAGVGLIAWAAGALLGAGTASWWTALYRNLVLVDHPDSASKYLSSSQNSEIHAGPLTAVVALSTLLICAVLALPWFKFF